MSKRKYKEKQLTLQSITKQETLRLISPIVIVKKREEEKKDLPGQIIMKEQK